MVQKATEQPWLRTVGLGAALLVGAGALCRFAQRLIAASRRPSLANSRATRDSSASRWDGMLPPPPDALSRARQPEMSHVLIPVANPSTAGGLIQLASALRAPGSGMPLIALKIVTPPAGKPIEETQRYALAMREHYQDGLSQAAEWAQGKGVDLRTELRVAPDVPSGILEYAGELPGMGLLLLGWRGSVSPRRSKRSINQEMLSRARAHVAVLLQRDDRPIHRVLVPVGWGPHARLGLRLAERLMQNGHARVTALRVLPDAGNVDWEAERAALVQLLTVEAPTLRFDTELLLARGPNVASAILTEAKRQEYDLLIIGASDQWWFSNWLFGALPDRVADRAPCSVLLVRRFEENNQPPEEPNAEGA